MPRGAPLAAPRHATKAGSGGTKLLTPAGTAPASSWGDSAGVRHLLPLHYQPLNGRVGVGMRVR